MSLYKQPTDHLVTVPREPTKAMLDAGRIHGWDDPEHEGSCIGHPETRADVYRAMVAAAPFLSGRDQHQEETRSAIIASLGKSLREYADGPPKGVDLERWAHGVVDALKGVVNAALSPEAPASLPEE